MAEFILSYYFFHALFCGETVVYYQKLILSGNLRERMRNALVLIPDHVLPSQLASSI